jgi:hypothetical protein
MIFGFLAFSASRLDTCFSLLPPFQQTEIREIGNWSLRGTGVIRKRVIHLTSNVSGPLGGVCNRVPTTSQDWISEIRVTFSGDVLTFFLSRNLCPSPSNSYFPGLQVSFNPVLDNHSIVVQFSGDGIFGRRECQIPFGFPPISISFRISKQDNTLTVSKLEDPFVCPSVSIGDSHQFGYLSLFATSPSNCTQCFTELSAIRHFSLSEDTNVPLAGLSDFNRKYLEEAKEERTIKKMRRRAHMLTVSKYAEKLDRGDGELDGEDSDLRDALKESSEMIQRASRCVSAANFSVFINSKVIPVLAKAQARFERVSDALFAMKAEMLSIWEDSQRELKLMNADVRHIMNLLQAEAIEAGNEIQARMLPQSLVFERPKVEFFHRLLFVLSIAELLCFIAFCVQYHRKNLARKRA